MELRTMRYFLAAAREENITRAAELLHVTQSALSKQLKALEDELEKNCLCAAVIDISKWCGNNMDKLHLEGSFRLSYIPVRHKLIRKYQKERKKKMIGMQRDEYNINRFYQFLPESVKLNCFER